MASYSHWCGACRTTSERLRTYAEALEAQAGHRAGVHGGRIPVGERIDLHRTEGWADADPAERWITVVLAAVALLVIAYNVL
ncbi:hypothetical protein ABZ593_21080 [Streptomyces sp. NPDC012617]|uniref:hypothetical protein n=1 Tax=Streptomyces TaxID=1883 RepID=UPI0033EF25DC